MSSRDIVLGELHYQFKRADNAYQNYQHECIYLHALSIREANNRIYKLLDLNLGLFNDKLSLHALELIAHYDIWMAQFDELVLQLNPSISTHFVFERFPGSLPFPKAAKEAFTEAFKKLNI